MVQILANLVLLLLFRIKIPFNFEPKGIQQKGGTEPEVKPEVEKSGDSRFHLQLQSV